MTVDEVKAAFKRHDDEFLRFDRIAEPRHRRPDVCAFLLIDAAVPGTRDIVQSATHDQIWLLDADLDVFAAVASDDLIRDLARCGVFLDGEMESLSMYV